MACPTLLEVKFDPSKCKEEQLLYVVLVLDADPNDGLIVDELVQRTC